VNVENSDKIFKKLQKTLEISYTKRLL